MLIVGYLIATIIPLLVLYIIYTLDLYKTGNFRFVLLCFACGCLAVAGAGQLNNYLINNNYLTYDELFRFGAPFVEEILKALILFYLVSRTDFTYFVDGAIYGFGAGMGFAIAENYFYLYNSQGGEFATAIGRVISTNLIHASASALVGVALGLARFERGPRRIFTSAVGLLLAMLLHAIFNNVITPNDYFQITGMWGTAVAALIGLAAALSITTIIRRGLAEEKIWIEEKLGAADRVTGGEAAMVQRLENIQDVLAPLAERFGIEKAEEIERFLTMQARLGILRKSMEKLSGDERMTRAIETQMAQIRQDMDEARRNVGSYAMLYLRHTIPPDASPLWGRLESLIQERIAARPAGSSGPSVWASLGKRTVNTAAAETDASVDQAAPAQQTALAEPDALAEQAALAEPAAPPPPAAQEPEPAPPPVPAEAEPVRPAGGLFAAAAAKKTNPAAPGSAKAGLPFGSAAAARKVNDPPAIETEPTVKVEDPTEK